MLGMSLAVRGNVCWIRWIGRVCMVYGCPVVLGVNRMCNLGGKRECVYNLVGCVLVEDRYLWGLWNRIQ